MTELEPGDGPAEAADSPEMTAALDAAIALTRALVITGAQVMAQYAQDVTFPQYRALVLVAYQGPQRPSELASAIGVSQATAGRIISALARKGLVERCRDPEDNRAVVATVAPAGQVVVSRVTESRRNVLRGVFAGMDAAKYPCVTDFLTAIVVGIGESQVAKGELMYASEDW